MQNLLYFIFCFLNLLSIICFILFIRIHLGNRKKAEKRFFEITTCKNCGSRNYQTKMQKTERTIFQPIPRTDIKGIKRTEKHLTIKCKKCYNNMYEDSFSKDEENDEYYSSEKFYWNVPDTEIISELREKYFNTSCSSYLLLVIGFVLPIIGFILFIII